MHRRRNYVPEDDNGNLTVLDHRLGASSVARYEYGYDANGMRTSMVDNNGLHDYAYDTLYQIVNATHPTVTNPSESFQYDAAGNRLLDETRAYQYDELNQLTEDDEFVYEYDLDGNMVLKVEKAFGDSTKFHWDIENRLIRVEKPGTLAEYSYGPLGRRLAKTVNGATTEFRYDGEDLILELDDAGGVIGSWTFGPGIDQPLAMNRSGVNHYYVADGLGSVAALTDESGAVAQTYEYGVFGEITEQTGSLDNPFAYTGREWEPEVGLYYYRVRWYSAIAGRFVSKDPVGFLAGDPNLYLYTLNSPASLVDPTGLWQITFTGGYGIAATISFGKNEGNWNVNGGIGFGLGAEVSTDWRDSDPNRPNAPEGRCHGQAAQLALEMFGEVEILPEFLGFEAGAKLFSKSDECGVEVGTNWRAGADIVLVSPGAEGTLSFYGDNNTGEYSTRAYGGNDTKWSFGAVGFVGVTGGYSW